MRWFLDKYLLAFLLVLWIIPVLFRLPVSTVSAGLCEAASAQHALGGSLFTPAETDLVVYFVDVGQGDAILIDYGDTEVLIDGGPLSPGVVDFIQPYVQAPLETVVATHMDADHIGGLTAVINNYDIVEIWTNGDTAETQTYANFSAAVSASTGTVQVAGRGDTISAGDLDFSVLSPVDASGTSNNNSVVLNLEFGDVSFQFQGDAEIAAEESMLGAGLIQPSTILKVGHHGSSTASSPAFLAALQPQVAVYMCGIDNRYGHPAAATLEALAEIGAAIFGTDNLGTIRISTDGGSYRVNDQVSTTTTLISSANPAAQGETLTFTAAVSGPQPECGTPSGWVSFKDGDQLLGTSELDSTGQAAFTTVDLGLGQHTITAFYTGDSSFITSSARLEQSVYPGLTAAVDYLIQLYDSEVGLCRETSTSEPLANEIVTRDNQTFHSSTDKTFWIASDNYLESLALAKYDPELAELIKQKCFQYYSGVDLWPYQVLEGNPIPLTLSGPQNYVLEHSENSTIALNLYDGEISGTTYLDYPTCGDVLVYQALNYYLQGYPLGWAHGLYLEAYRMFDGKGVADAHHQADNESRYDNMKLALLLLGARVLNLEVDLTGIEQQLWSAQKSESPAFGGLTALMDADGQPSGTANGETTALALLACNTDLITQLQQARRQIDHTDHLDISFDSAAFSLNQSLINGLTALPLLNDWEITLDNTLEWTVPQNDPAPRAALGFYSSLADPGNASIQLIEYSGGALDVIAHDAEHPEGYKLDTGSLAWSNPLTLAFSSDNLTISSPVGSCVLSLPGFPLAYMTAGSTQADECRGGKVDIRVAGAGLPVTSLLASSVATSVYSQPVTFTASLSALSPVTAIPTGSVTFYLDTIALGSASLDSTGEAAITTSALEVGTHHLSVVYDGDYDFGPALTPGLPHTVAPASTTTTLTASDNRTQKGQTVVFTALVQSAAPAAGTPSGTVIFSDETGELSLQELDSAGQAACTLSTLAVGTHTITAEYAGDAHFENSTSPAVYHTVSSTSGGSGGGGGGGGSTTGSKISLGGFSGATALTVNSSGVVETAAALHTTDGQLAIGIRPQTRLLNAAGSVLTTLTAARLSSPPPVEDNRLLLTAYTLGPGGARFSPDLELAFTYDPAQLPADVPESGLYLACYDGIEWQPLDSVLDADAHTVTAHTAHFSTYALIGQKQLPAVDETVSGPADAGPVAETTDNQPEPLTSTPPLDTPTGSVDQPLPAAGPNSAVSSPAVVDSEIPGDPDGTVPVDNSQLAWLWIVLGGMGVITLAVVSLIIRRRKTA